MYNTHVGEKRIKCKEFFDRPVSRSLCILNSKLTREHRNRNHLIFIVYFLRLMYPQAGSKLKKINACDTRNNGGDGDDLQCVLSPCTRKIKSHCRIHQCSICSFFFALSCVYNSFYTLRTLRGCNVLKRKIKLMSHLKPNAVYLKSYQLHLLNLNKT